jgi:hypothetical protein
MRHTEVLWAESDIICYYASNHLGVGILEQEAGCGAYCEDVLAVASIHTIHENPPFAGRKQGVDVPRQRGLPRAVRAEHRDELPGGDAQVYAGQRRASLASWAIRATRATRAPWAIRATRATLAP